MKLHDIRNILEIHVLLHKMNIRSCWIISAYNILDWYWISNENPVFKHRLNSI